MDTDVLVVGAGPTGLMMANQLRRRGVRAMIIDRHAGPTQQTRAIAVQARTLEIYSRLGIIDQALELGKLTNGANLWARGRHTARIPLGDIGRDMSPYPFVLILVQDDNERILGDALRKQGMDVNWNTELVGLTQSSDRVTTRLKQPDGTVREVTAGWVAGCDGGRSSVRELNGIQFLGAPYEHVFFVADTQATGPMVPGEINVYLWEDGFHLVFPMRGENHWRIVGILPAELRGKDDLTFDEVVPSMRQEAGTALTFQKCTWFSTYRIHHRRAERFRDRRCFVVGDAAHVHSPVGGQGMNTGLQDSYNLAWKLALVASGRANESLLDSYAGERIPVAQRLLSSTDRGFSIIVSNSGLARVFRTRILAKIMARAMHFEGIRRLAFRSVSQIGIEYRNSSLSENLPGLPDKAPRAGDRFPWVRLKLEPNGPVEDLYGKLDDTGFNLILIGQPSRPHGALGLDDLLRVHTVPSDPHNDRELARARIPQPSFFLLRPDCYIGLAGTQLDADAAMRYVSGRLKLRPPKLGRTSPHVESESRLEPV
ncbi:MAG TPA: FAD-dependent monooxygenase [Candidatus Eisenbacteria bacterium]|nr:FAD-dependent monooxygenase [Candidatus Eisenbacteria bacterium]